MHCRSKRCTVANNQVVFCILFLYLLGWICTAGLWPRPVSNRSIKQSGWGCPYWKYYNHCAPQLGRATAVSRFTQALTRLMSTQGRENNAPPRRMFCNARKTRACLTPCLYCSRTLGTTRAGQNRTCTCAFGACMIIINKDLSRGTPKLRSYIHGRVYTRF